MAGEHEHELVNIPDDLKLIGDGDLSQLETQAVTEFDRVSADTADVTPESVEYLTRLTHGIGRIRAEVQARQVRTDAENRSQQARLDEQRRALGTQVHGSPAPSTEIVPVDAEGIAAAAARGAVAALATVMGANGGASLEELTSRATRAVTATPRRSATLPSLPAQRLSVTAGVDIPGIARGGELPDLDALVDAMQRRARGMPVTRDGHGNEQLVATLRNEFEHTIDDRTSPAQVEELFRYLTSPDKQQALVAGGGWCAPSEVRYDFFNVACEDGLIDLPTFGVSRGGIRWPTSPSLADAFGSNGMAPFAVTFSNTSVPWLWTETDDILTVTGSTNKPCLRVPCPTFNEARLECYGVCLTAGNLTDDAYPEATRNTLQLLMSAHQHAMNARYIATMVSLSTAIVSGGDYAGTTSMPVYNQVLGGLSLAAVDYRARYGMCEDDVLEVVAPYWVLSEIQADLAWRNGIDLLSVSTAQINGYFADRNLRVQWAGDWQVRTTGLPGHSAGMTAWPTSADFMIYAAGTFIRGNGLSLDLGVVRDSVLNAENDFTAAWSEECHLIARVGHESKLFRIGFSVNGAAAPAVALGSNL